LRKRRVVVAPEARDELEALYTDIARTASPERDDIREGVRIVGFERRVTIVFHVDAGRVTILRLFSGGKDWEGLVA